MNGWEYYGTKTLQVVPYMPDTPVYNDRTMPFLYNKLKEEGKIAATFCGEQKSLDEFISYFHRIKTVQVLCRVSGNFTVAPVGMSWIDLPRGVDGARACQCGFAFWGDTSRTEDMRSLARLGLAYFFIDLKVDVLHGVQLASNIAARNFSQKMGFHEVAMVPRWHYVEEDGKGGLLVDARVMMLEKRYFMPEFEEWFETQERRS